MYRMRRSRIITPPWLRLPGKGITPSRWAGGRPGTGCGRPYLRAKLCHRRRSAKAGRRRLLNLVLGQDAGGGQGAKRRRRRLLGRQRRGEVEIRSQITTVAAADHEDLVGRGER